MGLHALYSVGFFTPIYDPKRPIFSFVEDYFSLSGRKAHAVLDPDILGNQGTLLIPHETTWWKTGLKVISYATLIIPTLMLCAKIAMRLTERVSYHEIKDSIKSERAFQLLSKEINEIDIGDFAIPQEFLEQIEVLIPVIKKKKRNEAIVWNGNVKNFPQFAVIACREEELSQNYINTLEYVHRVCKRNKLDHILIPKARKVKIGDQSFIIQANPPRRLDQHELEWRFYEFSHSLDKAMEQMAILIAKTGLKGLAWTNMVLVDDDPEFRGTRRVALTDFSSTGSAHKGLFGSEVLIPDLFGLFSCLTTKVQVNKALDIAYKYGITRPSITFPFEALVNRRIENFKALRDYYEEKGLVNNPRKELEVKSNSLDLNIGEKGEIEVTHITYRDSKEKRLVTAKVEITMENAIEDMVYWINSQIKNSPKSSVHQMRYLSINLIQEERLRGYQHLNWLHPILEQLNEKGHIYDYKWPSMPLIEPIIIQA